jgi:chaperonin cofactor prefoldin
MINNINNNVDPILILQQRLDYLKKEGKVTEQQCSKLKNKLQTIKEKLPSNSNNTPKSKK